MLCSDGEDSVERRKEREREGGRRRKKKEENMFHDMVLLFKTSSCNFMQ